VSALHGKSSVLAAALAASAFTASQALAQDPPDLNARIDALQAQIDQLKAERQAQKTAEQQAATQSVLTDANHHSQLFDAQGVLAGYTEGRFILQSEDGKYLAHPWIQVQFRETTDYREGVSQKGFGHYDTQSGFEVRRLKFGVDGNLFGPNLTYFTQFAVDRHTGNVQLEMAWAKYQFDDSPFAIRAGQFKDPLDHEQLATSRLFPAIDRTLVNDAFANGEGFVKGVSLIYDPATFVRGEAAFTSGLRNFNTNFEQFPNTGIPADWGTSGRVEFKPFGSWKDYDQITAYGVKRNTLGLGLGADYTEAGTTATLTHVADAQFQTSGGLSLYGAYLGRYTRGNTAAKGADTYDPTARFQVAWAIDRHWEPYGRFEYIHFDGREFAAHTKTNVEVITGGVNYYIYGQSFKVQFDVSYLPHGSPVNDDGFGILSNTAGRNEFIGRAQVQLLL